MACSSTSFLKEAWIDKDIPHVLLDARPAAEACRRVHSGRRFAFQRSTVKAALAQFPDKKQKAPIMVYDAGSGDAAIDGGEDDRRGWLRPT